MIRIHLSFAGDEVERFSTEKDEITIGRSSDNDVAIDNVGVSKLHARIFERDGQLMVEDCESTNGTSLNGEKIQAATPLEEGDTISILKYSLIVSTEDPEPGDSDCVETYRL